MLDVQQIERALERNIAEMETGEQKVIAGLHQGMTVAEEMTRLLNLPRAEPIPEENKDYEDWAAMLRRLGRTLCKDWPVYNDEDVFLKNLGLEDHLEPSQAGIRDWRLKIANASPGTDEPTIDQQYAREARQFVWLLSGLAPSLPAIIHINIMSHIYEAETLARIHADGEDWERSVKQQCDEQYRLAIVELHRWYKLIGALTIATRYVKIKCLHLFAKLFIMAALADKDNGSDCAEFLRRCNIKTADPKSTLAKLQELFGAGISTHLAIMPDVAPQSLFGERWMIDLIRYSRIRLEFDAINPAESIRPPRDIARNVRGMFGETEQ